VLKKKFVGSSFFFTPGADSWYNAAYAAARRTFERVVVRA
jgi:hypothetical protein